MRNIITNLKQKVGDKFVVFNNKGVNLYCGYYVTECCGHMVLVGSQHCRTVWVNYNNELRSSTSFEF